MEFPGLRVVCGYEIVGHTYGIADSNFGKLCMDPEGLYGTQAPLLETQDDVARLVERVHRKHCAPGTTVVAEVVEVSFDYERKMADAGVLRPYPGVVGPAAAHVFSWKLTEEGAKLKVGLHLGKIDGKTGMHEKPPQPYYHVV